MSVAGDASARRIPHCVVGDDGALPDSPRPAAFDRSLGSAFGTARVQRLCAVAAKLLHCPIAEVTVLGTGAELVAASYEARGPSMLARSRRLKSSAAATVLAADTPLAVPDVDLHTGMKDLELPGGPSAKSYLGVPLRGADRVVLGRLCVVDEVAREWTAEQIYALRLLADEVVIELERVDGWDASSAAAAWLELTLAGADIGRFDFDPRTQVLRCDERLMAMLGFATDTFVPHLDFLKGRVHPGDWTRLMRAVAVAVESLADFHNDCRVLGSDGVSRELSVRGRVLGTLPGEPVRIIGVANDVTIYRETRHELTRLLETMPSAFIRTDRRGLVNAVNRGAEVLCGRPREAWLGDGLWKAFPEPLGAELRTTYERARATGVADRVETYLETANAWVRVQVWPDQAGTSLFIDRLADRETVEHRPVHDAESGLADGVLRAQSVILRPEFASAGAARRLLRQVLADTGRQAWTDAAELAVTEVVANAVLHAHTPIEMAIEVRPEALHVAVRDSNPELPAAVDCTVDATTGRGMGLVSALTQRCGVNSLGDEGKVVWFTVGAEPPEHPAGDQATRWENGSDGLLSDEADADEVVAVVLAAMPPTLWLAAHQHHDTLLRELALHFPEPDGIGEDLLAAGRARRLVAQALDEALARARPDGVGRAARSPEPANPREWLPAQVDLELRVPHHLGPAFVALRDALDLAEWLSVAGQLLVSPGLPELIELRDWVCDEVVAQLDGVAATPWPGTAQQRFETIVHARARPDETGWDASAVSEATLGMVAVDDANRIVAISRPLASQLGWTVDELVGRRVVTLIPPQLREAHVAGFSRHLNTGEASMIGVPLQLPVLTKDGSLMECRLLIERGAPNGGRPYYIAWIDPV